MKLNLPPSYLHIHRTWLGGIGVLSQLGAEAPFREVTITGPDAADLAASLAMVRAQRGPYQPAQAAIVHLPGGLTALRIDFAAPGPLGLLTGGASG